MRYEKRWKEYQIPDELWTADGEEWWNYGGFVAGLRLAIEVARDKQSVGKPAQSVARILEKILNECKKKEIQRIYKKNK